MALLRILCWALIFILRLYNTIIIIIIIFIIIYYSDLLL